MPRRKRLLKEPVRYCQAPGCGKQLVRHRRPCGQWEAFVAMGKRKFCNKDCMGAACTKEFPEKHCALSSCGKVLVRKREKCGRIKGRYKFTRRTHCGHGCATKDHHQKSAPAPIRICQLPTCGKEIPRKRHPNGRLEAMVLFKKRQYCNRQCSGAHRKLLNGH